MCLGGLEASVLLVLTEIVKKKNKRRAQATDKQREGEFSAKGEKGEEKNKGGDGPGCRRGGGGLMRLGVTRAPLDKADTHTLVPLRRMRKREEEERERWSEGDETAAVAPGRSTRRTRTEWRMQRKTRRSTTAALRRASTDAPPPCRCLSSALTRCLLGLACVLACWLGFRSSCQVRLCVCRGGVCVCVWSGDRDEESCGPSRVGRGQQLGRQVEICASAQVGRCST